MLFAAIIQATGYGSWLLLPDSPDLQAWLTVLIVSIVHLNTLLVCTSLVSFHLSGSLIEKEGVFPPVVETFRGSTHKLDFLRDDIVDKNSDITNSNSISV